VLQTLPVCSPDVSGAPVPCDVMRSAAGQTAWRESQSLLQLYPFAVRSACEYEAGEPLKPRLRRNERDLFPGLAPPRTERRRAGEKLAAP
jgi:hypothetical protein